MFDEESLTPADRELETALRSLRPTPARIEAAALASGRRAAARRKRFWPMAAAAAALVAAGAAWLALPSDPLSTNFTAPRSDIVSLQVQWQPPTLLVYRQALAQSPEALNDLLDRQAIAGRGSNRELTPVGVATVWNADLYSHVGEM